jgi:pSer/pThr/pTyr-binding forkhead associated (FHA) protein
MAVRLVVRAPFAADASAELAFEFDQTRVLIGRGASADVRLPHAAVSESHAALRLEGSGYVLTDEGSTNGTRVNGVRLVPGRGKALRSGDVVEVAGFLLTFHAGIATTLPTSSEQTAALARRLVREVLDPHGAASAPARLVVVGGPQAGARLEVPPPPARLLIGRGETCDLVLLDADCSREHVELVRDLEGCLARDLGSKNGARVNDRPLRERRLRDRDELLVGQTVVLYEDPADAAIRALDGVPDAPPPAAALDESSPSPLPAAMDSPDSRGAAPAPSEALPSAPLSSPVAAPPRERRRPTGVSADVVIYVLAGLVLAASAVALFVLLRSG